MKIIRPSLAVLFLALLFVQLSIAKNDKKAKKINNGKDERFHFSKSTSLPLLLSCPEGTTKLLVKGVSLKTGGEYIAVRNYVKPVQDECDANLVVFAGDIYQCNATMSAINDNIRNNNANNNGGGNKVRVEAFLSAEEYVVTFFCNNRASDSAELRIATATGKKDLELTCDADALMILHDTSDPDYLLVDETQKDINDVTYEQKRLNHTSIHYTISRGELTGTEITASYQCITAEAAEYIIQ